MTTIVYNHKDKQIACDSRISSGNIITSDEHIKYAFDNGVTWFFCGKAGETEMFISTFKELTIATEHLDVCAFFVENGNVYQASIENNIFRSCLIDFSDSIGSGCEFALTALDLGKTAKEAIECAISRDMYSGGKIHVYDIESGKFI
jgi:20S proteasome alpha/beta subunit